MKKTIIVTITLLMVAITAAKAINPIPSYKVVIYHSTVFQEVQLGIDTASLTKEKRDMNIQNSGGNYGPEALVVIAYLYRLDLRIPQGPYTIAAGETLSVPIDGKPWGVILIPSRPTIVSVWID
jgi:hypothetical protein